MDSDELCELLIEGQNRLIEEKIYWRWVLYSTISPEPVSFDKYKESLKTFRPKSSKEILEEQEELLDLFAQGCKKVEI